MSYLSLFADWLCQRLEPIAIICYPITTRRLLHLIFIVNAISYNVWISRSNGHQNEYSHSHTCSHSTHFDLQKVSLETIHIQAAQTVHIFFACSNKWTCHVSRVLYIHARQVTIITIIIDDDTSIKTPCINNKWNAANTHTERERERKKERDIYTQMTTVVNTNIRNKF